MPITKAIIPVAGWGTRRLPITKAIEKAMLPVGNRPIIDYSVQELVQAGIKDIFLIVNNSEFCQVKAFYEKNPALEQYLIAHNKSNYLTNINPLPDDVTIHYLPQDPLGKYGTAVPITMAVEKYQINEPILVYMGDDFIWNPGGESATESLLAALKDPSDSVILGVEIPKEKVSRYGVLSVTDGQLTHIVEKPSVEEAPSNLISVGKYIMSPDLLQAIVNYTNANNFGPDDQEYMVTDPISTYINNGGVMRVASTTGEFLDGGSLEGWLHANNVVCQSQ